jgi:hypothetical protein
MPKGGQKDILYIPRKIQLPGPFVVTIRNINSTKMKEKHGEFYDAIYDPDTMTIDLNAKLPHQRKWYVYSQQYIHVVDSWVRWLMEKGISVA